MTHLCAIEFRRVYEPSEDTFLLLDALEANFDDFAAKRPSLILEVGSGSGCVVTFLSKLLRDIGPVFSLATDINPHAVRATQHTAMRNLISVDPIMTSMCDGTRLDGLVDVLVFNPPYVPTEIDEVILPSSSHRIHSESIIDAAFAGGPDGRYWIDIFMPQIPKLLSASGSCWMVTIENNRPQELMDWAHRQFGLQAEIVKKQKAGCEMLYILKLWKNLADRDKNK